MTEGQPDDMAQRTRERPWTPELKMQFFKEAFTALLALIIVGVTVVLAFRSFDMVGNTGKMGDVKDLLTIMLGVAGVVIGYYFGRIPSDARAAQATSNADTAVRQREQMKATAKVLADKMNNVIADSAGSATGDDQKPVNHSDMHEIRDQLQGMAASDP